MLLKLRREILPGNTDLKDSHVTDFCARADYPREQEQSARSEVQVGTPGTTHLRSGRARESIRERSRYDERQEDVTQVKEIS